MNKELRIIETPDQRVYWTSDTHFNHNKDFVYGARGYPTSRAHTDGVIGGINERVRPNDILFHLGDFCLNTDESGFNELLSRINCQNIYHLWGNHNNPVWSVYQNRVRSMFENRSELPYDREVEVYPFQYRNIRFLGNYAEVLVNGYMFILSHYPIHVFNYMNKGAKHLCGHSHGTLPFSDQHNTTSKVLDVGWDDFGKVLSFEEILTIMKKKDIFEPGDHHGKLKKPEVTREG